MSDNPIDNRMQIGYGSTWHLLRCLGFQRGRFNAIVFKVTAACDITWLDFPPYADSLTYPREHPILDGEWVRVDFLGESHPLRAEYNRFWPDRGTPQHWDALGKGTFDGEREWLLVEAKAHIDEIKKERYGSHESN